MPSKSANKQFTEHFQLWVGFTQRSHSRKPPPLFLANRSLHLERLFTLVGLRNQWSSELPPSMKGCMTEGGQGQALKADALDLRQKIPRKRSAL